MRKQIFRQALVAALCLFSLAASAQVKFGLKAGLNATSMSFSEDVFDASNRTGWFVGPTLKVSLPLTGLGIDVSALYDYRSAKVSSADASRETVKQQQIAIPVNLRYGVGLGSTAGIFVFAGPQWGINVGDKDFKWSQDSSYSLKKSNFSVNVGLGATLLKHLQLSASYNIACGKSADATVTSVGSSVLSRDKSHNNSWQIGLAWFF